MLSCAFVTGGYAGVATHDGTFRITILAIEAANWHHLFSDLQPVDLNESTGKLTVSGGGENLPPFAEDAEANFGIGQRVLFKQVVAMADLGMATLQEFQPGWNRAEKVSHCQGSAFRGSGCCNFGDVPIGCAHLRPL